MGLFNSHFKLPDSYVKPGLEVKFALEEAEKIGAKTYFLGAHNDEVTWGRLLHETRMTIPHYIFKRFQYMNSTFWGCEREEILGRQYNSTTSQYAE